MLERHQKEWVAMPRGRMMPQTLHVMALAVVMGRFKKGRMVVIDYLRAVVW